jgi:hypothetical protein
LSPGDALAEEAKALAKGSSLLLPFSLAVNRQRQRWRTNERCLPSPLLDVLALNVGNDRIQRTSEKFVCRLDARSCAIEKVGRRYLVAGLLVRKRACIGQLGPHRSLVSTAILDERKSRTVIRELRKLHTTFGNFGLFHLPTEQLICRINMLL